MTKDEFIRPYLLLVCQPWGKRYVLEMPEGKVQGEFYFSHVRSADGGTWAKVCELYAQGDHWPTLNELKQSLKAMAPQPRRLTDQRPGDAMPDDVRQFLDRLNGNVKDIPSVAEHE